MGKKNTLTTKLVAKYHGRFKYSPNNPNPTVYTPDEGIYAEAINCLVGKYKIDKLAELKLIHNPTEYQMEKIEEIERDIYLATVKPENNVYYIMDENYNIIFETNKIFKWGNFTDQINKKMIRYNLTKEDFRTESTLDMLKERIRIDNELKKIAKT